VALEEGRSRVVPVALPIGFVKPTAESVPRVGRSGADFSAAKSSFIKFRIEGVETPIDLPIDGALKLFRKD
jgi:hypothetical protein